MALTLAQIASVVDDIAPFRLAYDWDNVGLQIGDPRQEVDNLLVALEVNEACLDAARKASCQAILAHHPLIFGKQTSVRSDSLSGRLQMELIRAQMGLIVAHTNLDRVQQGTNGALAAKMRLGELKVLEPAALHEYYKFTVFVPRDYTPQVIDAIHRGGGGWIGNYSHCTFRAPGVGTYVPEEGSHPFAGEQGQFEQANEDRLESLVSQRALKSVLREVMLAHPYEEVAYDVFPLYDANPRFGLGVTGVLPEALSLHELATRLSLACATKTVAMVGEPERMMRRVAVVTGAAGGTVDLVRPDVADVFVTGELSYHRAVEAKERGLCVITLGHAASERVFAQFLRGELLTHKDVAESQLAIHAFEDFPEPFIPLEIK